ncbi:MAG TPA: hypothetical protein VIS07_08080 [Candidatus Binatia bacterium]
MLSHRTQAFASLALGLLVAAAVLLPLDAGSWWVGRAEAGTYCTSRGNATYCDDGTTFHQYGNYIRSNRGKSWHRYGSHVYGSDGSWYADHGDSVTSYSKRRPSALESRIVPEGLFGRGARKDK